MHALSTVGTRCTVPMSNTEAIFISTLPDVRARHMLTYNHLATNLAAYRYLSKVGAGTYRWLVPTR